MTVTKQFCISMLLGKYYGLGVLMALGAGALTFFVMFLFNLLNTKDFD